MLVYHEAYTAVGEYEVTHIWEHLDNQITTLVIDGETIITTRWHRFYADVG